MTQPNQSNPTNEQELREQLAAIEHERWADWQAWCHKVLREMIRYNDMESNLEEILSRWEKQIETPYAELSEAEKQSDREQVDRYWHLIQAHTAAEIAKVLDRLEAELNEQKKAAETNLAYHVDVTKNERLIRDWQGTVHGIEFCRPAIQAERVKLKEVK